MTALRAGIWTCLDPGGTSRIGPGNPGWELARAIIATHKPGSRGAEPLPPSRQPGGELMRPLVYRCVALLTYGGLLAAGRC